MIRRKDVNFQENIIFLTKKSPACAGLLFICYKLDFLWS